MRHWRLWQFYELSYRNSKGAAAERRGLKKARAPLKDAGESLMRSPSESEGAEHFAARVVLGKQRSPQTSGLVCSASEV